MYKHDPLTPYFPDFGLPFGGHLNPENRWVRKAALIPWKLVEQEYKQRLTGSTQGCPAITARMAFAALIIREELRLSDRETVEQISENPYFQYFAGNMKPCAGSRGSRLGRMNWTAFQLKENLGRGSADLDGLGLWRNSPKLHGL
jgi:hypothetical protein